MTKKTTFFSLLLSLYFLATSIYAYGLPVINTSDVIIQTQNNQPELNTCLNQEDIVSLENYSQTIVVITPSGCLTSDVELIIEKVIPKLSLPIVGVGSSELDEDLRISSTERVVQESKNKRFGILKLSTWWLFVTISIVNATSPGTGILLAITTSLSCGFSRTLYTTLGHLCAMFLASAVAVYGLSYILDSSKYFLIGFKFLAALYLIYLGITQWKSKVNIFSTLVSSTPLQVNKLSLFTHGLLVGILNPHTILFFTAIAPKFLDATKSLSLQLIVIASTYMVISFCALMSYAGAANSVKRWFAQPRRELWFRRVSGATFVTLGLAFLV